CSFVCSTLAAAQPPRGVTPAPRRDTPVQVKRATATRVGEPRVIDGILDERVWQEANSLGDFVQPEPTEGDPASEHTEVRLLFDNKMLYAPGVCFASADCEL